MTLVIPAESTKSSAPIPSFASTSRGAGGLQQVAQAVARAKRVVVVCGAGISVEAGIPDFRSPDGLFKTLKTDNPQEALSSGKDLFDARVFNAPQSLALFNRMIARLHESASAGSPTAFHKLLRCLDDKSKLLRVYTQNIDALEEKAGLSLGAPIWPAAPPKTPKKPASQPNLVQPNRDQVDSPMSMDDEPQGRNLFMPRPGTFSPPTPSRSGALSPPNGVLSPPKTPSRRPSPSAQAFQAPRCIAVHGTVKTLYCVHCSHSSSLAPHAVTLEQGMSVDCPQCAELDNVRRVIGKRERGVGRLRPSVVLYGEEHKEGEAVGECVRRDLTGLGDLQPGERAKAGARPDLLIVAGTSLQVPGTKRIVKEFAKAVRAGPGSPSPTKDKDGSPFTRSEPTTPVGSRKGSVQLESPIRTIYVNLDFPTPARDWEAVFDVWVQGDVQAFAKVVQATLDAEDRAREAREAALAAKRPTTPKRPATPKALMALKNSGRRKSASDRVPVSPARPTPKKSAKKGHKSDTDNVAEDHSLSSSKSSPSLKRVRVRQEVVVEIPLQKKRKPSLAQAEVKGLTQQQDKDKDEDRALEDLFRTVQLGLRSRRGSTQD